MKNILLHLRIPFSFFLLPIYLFALSQSPAVDVTKAWWVFFILHFMLFPASNAYNSYYDKDEGSIGLLFTDCKFQFAKVEKDGLMKIFVEERKIL